MSYGGEETMLAGANRPSTGRPPYGIILGPSIDFSKPHVEPVIEGYDKKNVLGVGAEPPG